MTYALGETDRTTPRLVLPTTPYPVVAGEEALFGLAFANGGDDIVVRQVDITIPGGYDVARHGGKGAPLFAELGDGLRYPSEGWTWLSAKHIQWKGSVKVEKFKAEQFWVHVLITDDPDAATSIEPVTSNGPSATLRFGNGYEITSRSWGSAPGIIGFRVPPASQDRLPGEPPDGYPWIPVHGDAPLEQPFEVLGRATAWSKQNTSKYAVSPAASDVARFDNAVGNASLAVRERLVRAGSMLRADLDMESLSKELARANIEPRLALEIYAPPSRGCAPMKTLEVESARLPRMAVTSLLVHAPDIFGPSLYVGTQDGRVFRLNSAGLPMWSIETRGPVSAIVPIPGSGKVAIGTRAGELLRVGPLKEEVAALDLAADCLGVNALAADAARVFVACESGRIMSVLPATWDGVETAQLGASVQQLSLAGGDVYARSLAGVVRVDQATLAAQATKAIARPLGMAVGSAGVLVVDATRSWLLDAQTLSPLDEDLLPSPAAVAAAGDFTEDGVDDLAFIDHAMRLVVLDGASGAEHAAWNVVPEPLEFSHEFELQHEPYAPPHRPPVGDEIGGATRNWHESCTPVAEGRGYGERTICRRVVAPDARVLHVSAGRITLAYGGEGRVKLLHMSPQAVKWSYTLKEVPQVIASGAWTDGGLVIAYGNEEGGASARTDSGSSVLTSHPGTRTAKLAIATHLPRGAFFGTHLLVARLQWEVAPGVMQEARLLDWFELVSPEGHAITNPVYRATLALRLRDGT